MTQEEIDALWTENVQTLNRMEVGPGSMIKGLLHGIEDNGPAYVRLSGPAPHNVRYTVVEGSQDLIKQVGSMMGLIVTDWYIEAPDGMAPR